MWWTAAVCFVVRIIRAFSLISIFTLPLLQIKLSDRTSCIPFSFAGCLGAPLAADRRAIVIRHALIQYIPACGSAISPLASFFPKDDNPGELMSTMCGVHARGWAGVGACSAEGGRRPGRICRRAARGRLVLFSEPRRVSQ